MAIWLPERSSYLDDPTVGLNVDWSSPFAECWDTVWTFDRGYYPTKQEKNFVGTNTMTKGADASIVGTPFGARGLNCNATNAYFRNSVTLSSLVPIALGAIVWVSDASDGFFYCLGDNASQGAFCCLRIFSGNWYFHQKSTTGASSDQIITGPAVQANRFYAVAYDSGSGTASDQRMFINGLSVGTTSGGNQSATDSGYDFETFGGLWRNVYVGGSAGVVLISAMRTMQRGINDPRREVLREWTANPFGLFK